MQRKNAGLISASSLLLGLFMFMRPVSAITLSPPVMDFTLNPGDVVADVIQVYNNEDVAFKIRPVAVNFYVKENDEVSGAPDFYDADEIRTGYELAPWFEFKDEAVVIPPGERVNIPISVRVPKNAQPGSHFGGIQIMAGKPDEVLAPDASFLSIERGTTVLVFVRVNGDAHDELNVTTFGVQQDVLAHLPADFTIRLKNDGTTHQRPVGNVIIENMWGRQVAALQVNPGPQYKGVLPGSARRFDVSWFHKRLPDGTSEYSQQLKNFAFGRYTATLLLNYGPVDGQKMMTVTTQFWVMPWLALLTFAGVAALLLAVIALAFRGYNRMIIRRYEAGRNKRKT